jgi:predicted transcriptional regulator
MARTGVPTTRLPTIDASAKAADVLHALGRDGVAVIVNADRVPVGVVTLADLPALHHRVETAHVARDLIARPLVTVRVDDSPKDVMQTLIDHGEGTGVVAVDSDCTYRGFVFTKTFRDMMPEIRERRELAQAKLNRLRELEPEIYERVERCAGWMTRLPR